MKVAVSYLKSDNYEKCIENIDNSNADFIHVDLCDGKYVEAKNFTIGGIIKLLSGTKKMLDIHLMVKDPMKYINDLAYLNVDTITVHLDSTKKPLEVIEYIKTIGIKVGVAINPDEDVDILNPYLDNIDKVLVMSVVPGKGGQKFMPEVVSKFDRLNELKKEYHFETEVDGGVNLETIRYLDNMDLDIIVCGSYITDSENYDESIKLIKY